jgi:Arc/MetJ-type ribon-helix-helix transcriptional regulator
VGTFAENTARLKDGFYAFPDRIFFDFGPFWNRFFNRFFARFTRRFHADFRSGAGQLRAASATVEKRCSRELFRGLKRRSESACENALRVASSTAHAVDFGSRFSRKTSVCPSRIPGPLAVLFARFSACLQRPIIAVMFVFQCVFPEKSGGWAQTRPPPHCGRLGRLGRFLRPGNVPAADRLCLLDLALKDAVKLNSRRQFKSPQPIALISESRTMIELTPGQQEFVDTQVALGTFRDPNDVIGAALEMLAHRQQEYALLETAIGQVERGEFSPLDIDEIKRRGRERKGIH